MRQDPEDGEKHTHTHTQRIALSLVKVGLEVREMILES